MIIGIVMVLSWACKILDDEARKPESEPKPERAVLEEATVYVTGDDGGTFYLAWEVWPPGRIKGEKEKVTGVIKPDPIPYYLNLDAIGASNSANGDATNIDIEARKTQPWEGDLAVVLEVNNEVVECAGTGDTKPGGFSNPELHFDAADQEDYKRDLRCRIELWVQ